MASFMISLGTIPVVTTRMKIDHGCTSSGMDALMILTHGQMVESGDAMVGGWSYFMFSISVVSRIGPGSRIGPVSRIGPGLV